MLRDNQPLAEQIGETIGYVNEIFDRKIESIKISVAEKSATTISGVVMGVILGILGLVFSVFGLATLAFWIAGRPELTMGFGIVTLVLLSLLLLIFLLRNILIVNPAVSKIISIFFADDDPQKPDNKS
ncbi:phage holin family protein [Neolewinella antarctica]|uniref:Mg2+ and Co2+ transporter CorA n=1 Tax=Neolewinella antarctica TaxID=442734 RepID=A0ABX0XGE5_9BACT|nr:phage holin family protein [Neolewinella antarctica]NJC28404.1 Mg2+ and Co2+ transporter CorA [Neolewinella antarctica]